jgi:hypothetical protein
MKIAIMKATMSVDAVDDVVRIWIATVMAILIVGGEAFFLSHPEKVIGANVWAFAVLAAGYFAYLAHNIYLSESEKKSAKIARCVNKWLVGPISIPLILIFTTVFTIIEYIFIFIYAFFIVWGVLLGPLFKLVKLVLRLLFILGRSIIHLGRKMYGSIIEYGSLLVVIFGCYVLGPMIMLGAFLCLTAFLLIFSRRKSFA